jgi:ferric iron reductase protein FhuF
MDWKKFNGYWRVKMIPPNLNYEHHLHQQLVIEQWFKVRKLPTVDLCDFTDHVYTDDGLITDYTKLDSIFEKWYC